MSADEVVKYYQYIEREDLPRFEFEIKVACYIAPGQDGATGQYGVPLEPSYPPYVEDIELLKARFLPDGNWHDYEYFVNKWDLEDEFEFDFDELFELCNEKSRKETPVL